MQSKLFELADFIIDNSVHFALWGSAPFLENATWYQLTCVNTNKQHDLYANGIVYFWKRYNLVFQLVLHVGVVFVWCKCFGFFNTIDNKVAMLSSCRDHWDFS